MRKPKIPILNRSLNRTITGTVLGWQSEATLMHILIKYPVTFYLSIPQIITPYEEIALWFHRYGVHNPKARTWTGILVAEDDTDLV